MRRLCGVLMAVLLLFGAAGVPAASADTANPNSYEVICEWSSGTAALGESISCTVSVKSTAGADSIGAVDLNFTYDGAVLQYLGSSAASGNTQVESGVGTLKIVRTDSMESGWAVGQTAQALITLSFKALAASEETELALASGEITNSGAGYEYGAAAVTAAAQTGPVITDTPQLEMRAQYESGMLTVYCTSRTDAERTVTVIAAVYRANGRMRAVRIDDLTLTKDVEKSVSFDFTGQTMITEYSMFAVDSGTYAPLCPAGGGSIE